MTPRPDTLKGRRIIYYTDARSFGGHEIASLHALQWMLEKGAQVDCFFQPSNQRLKKQVQTYAEKYPQLKLHPFSPPSVRFHYPYHLLRPKTVRRLSDDFRERRPDWVFVSQGNLGISALGVLAARKAELPCMSYIPMAHSFRDMGAKHAWLRDCCTHYIAKIPDRWLTCTPSQIEKLRKKGATQPIALLPNCIDLPEIACAQAARERLSLKPDDRVIGMVGRLNHTQKGCDLFSAALAAAATESLLRKATLLFIGEGEDWEQTRTQLENHGWRGRILHREWTDAPAQYLAAFDLLVLPSRFEGLPLSMQEAILCGVPIAASAVDGLASFLPSHWQCGPNNAPALLALLERFIQAPETYRQALPDLQATIRNEHSKNAFHRALETQLQATLSNRGAPFKAS